MENSNLKLVFDEGPCKGKVLECLAGATIRIGRVIRGNTFTIKDPEISQKHLLIEFDGEKWTISDLDSSNGTKVNGNKIQPLEPVGLNDGDLVKIGEKTTFTVQIEKTIEANVGRSQNQQLHRVSTRRTSAKKDILPVSDVRKIPGNGNVEKDEQIDVGVDLPETQPGRNLPRKAAGKRTSTKEALTLVSDICEDPKMLPNINNESLDGEKNVEVAFSDKKGQPQRPRRAVAKKAVVKKNPSLASEVDDDPQSFRHAKVENADELNETHIGVPENQPRRNPLRRAATKRSSAKDPAMVSEFPGSSKTLFDMKVDARDGLNFTDVGLSESQSRRNLPPRAAAKRTVAKKDPVLVSEVREDADTLANLSKETDKLNDINSSIQKNEKRVSVVSQIAETTFSPKIEKVSVLNAVVAPLVDHSRRNPPQRPSTRSRGKNNSSPVSELPGLPGTSNLGFGRRKQPANNCIGPKDNLAPLENMEDLDVRYSFTTNDTRRCQVEKTSNDTRCMENERHSDKAISSLKDLEKITLGEWFDRMEKHLPKHINAVADEVIAKLMRRQKQFEEFVSNDTHKVHN